MLNQVIEGRYTTRRAGGQYRYEGRWEETPEEIRWKVKAWRDKDYYCGEITGSIAGGPPTDIKGLMTVHIQESLEDIE